MNRLLPLLAIAAACSGSSTPPPPVETLEGSWRVDSSAVVGGQLPASVDRLAGASIVRGLLVEFAMDNGGSVLVGNAEDLLHTFYRDAGAITSYVQDPRPDPDDPTMLIVAWTWIGPAGQFEHWDVTLDSLDANRARLDLLIEWDQGRGRWQASLRRSAP